MKKRIFSMLISLGILLSLAAPVLAAEEPEPEYRLASATYGQNGSITDSFTYGDGGYLPTEITSNIWGLESFAYDEAWHIISDQVEGDRTFSRTYDEDGKLVEETISYVAPPSDYPQQEHIAHFYDENGNESLYKSEETYAAGTVTNVHEYVYDDVGNCIKDTRTSTDLTGNETVETIEYEYVLDSEGRVITETYTRNGEKGRTTTYTYDEQGQLLKEERSDGSSIQYYQIPLLEASLSRGDSSSFFSLNLVDPSDNHVWLSTLSTTSELQLTYDDNGYLVKVDGGAGNTVELTYEPVA